MKNHYIPVATLLPLIFFSIPVILNLFQDSIPQTIFASTRFVNNTNFDVSSFQTYGQADIPGIDLPTLIEIPLTTSEYNPFRYAAVKESSTGEFQPYQITSISFSTKGTATDQISGKALDPITDETLFSSVEFPIEGEEAIANIKIEYPRPVTSSQLKISLAQNVTTPKSIDIQNVQIQGDKGFINTLINNATYPNSNTIYYPESTSATWIIKITSAQPIRISELSLNIDTRPNETQTGLRFLARPNESYQIYLSSDRDPSHPYLAPGNYDKTTPTITLNYFNRQANPAYKASDRDKDSIPDKIDNCLNVSNLDQKDLNDNAKGDACEDFDLDGIMNDKDNCPSHPNPRQQDTDEDRLGDHCDESESRFTEQYPFIPWLGMGFGFVIVVILLTTTKAKFSPKSQINSQTNETSSNETHIDPPPSN